MAKVSTETKYEFSLEDVAQALGHSVGVPEGTPVGYEFVYKDVSSDEEQFARMELVKVIATVKIKKD